MSRVAKIMGAGFLGVGVGAAVLGGSGVAVADACADGTATDSPGILSGNLIQIPIHIPINVCGNTVSVLGSHNSAEDNVCVND